MKDCGWKFKSDHMKDQYFEIILISEFQVNHVFFITFNKSLRNVR